MSHQNLDVAAILHHEGYRMTPQRQMILDAVCEIGGHAIPDQVYELVSQRAPAVNRATVYRALKFLRELNLITATISRDGHITYEIAGPETHHHLVCRNCGLDVEVDAQEFDTLAESLRLKYGFTIETKHITLAGLCPECKMEG